MLVIKTKLYFSRWYQPYPKQRRVVLHLVLKKILWIYFQNSIAGNIEEMWGICQTASVMTPSMITRDKDKWFVIYFTGSDGILNLKLENCIDTTWKDRAHKIYGRELGLHQHFGFISACVYGMFSLALKF